jgi:lipoprotein-anchoring transpeptidase ErfK/SrfK
MSDQAISDPHLLIRKALQAVRQGDKIQARQHAAQAARLAPGLEEPWLILAALASPDASIAYLQRALEINPHSEKAQRGLAWALARKTESAKGQISGEVDLSEVDQPPSVDLSHTAPNQAVVKGEYDKSPQELDDTAPIKIFPSGGSPDEDERIQLPTAESLSDTAPVRVRKYAAPQKRPRLALILSLLLSSIFLLAAAGAAGAYFSMLSQNQTFSAAKPEDLLVKSSLTPTDTPTATVTPTATPTHTATLNPTSTHTPSPTSTSTSTHTPVPPTRTPLPSPTATKKVVAQPTKKPVTTQPGGSSGASGKTGRWIDVDLGKQRLYAYEGNSIIRTFVVSTGTRQHPTVRGQYRIYVKYRYASMSGPGYYLPNVPYVMYFYQGYGIHGTYWHNNFGTPMSHGCINMRTDDAGWLYNWASVGTLVNIH